MGAKKSKNNPFNRNAKGHEDCNVCGEPKKWVRFIHESINKMCTWCDCGVIDKNNIRVKTKSELEVEAETINII